MKTALNWGILGILAFAFMVSAGASALAGPGGSSGVGRGGDPDLLFGYLELRMPGDWREVSTDALWREPKKNFLMMHLGRIFSADWTRAGALEGVINSDLRYDLEVYLKHLAMRNLNEIDDRQIRAIVADMLDRGLFEDIAHSPYEFHFCSNNKQNGGWAARSNLGDRNGPICFDVLKMSTSQVLRGYRRTIALLIGILMHEHAHHFGYDDSNYCLAKFVVKDFLEQSNSLNLIYPAFY